MGSKVRTMNLMTTGTFLARATMVPQVIAVKGLFALQTKVDPSKEFSQGVTYMVMFADFDQA